MENSKISIQPVALEIVKEASALYKKAEKLLFERQELKEVIQNDKDALSLYHQMKVHLVELELKTEELRLANENDESEVAKYRSIFENMQDAYYEASQDGTILEISGSIEMISKGQYTREDLLGKSLISFYENQEERTIFYNELAKVGSISDHDVSLRNRDGSIINVAISSRLVYNEKSEPVKIIGSIRDITKRKQAEAEVVRLLKNENLLSKISKSTLYSTELDDFLNFSLAEMGESLQVSRVYMFEHHHATNTMDNTHEWCAPNIIPQIEELQEVPADAMPWWIETLVSEHVICFSDIEEIPDAVTKEILRPQNILSILVVPVFTGGRYAGFIGFDDCITHREWQQDEIEILHSISHIIAGFIERKRAEMALEESIQQLNIANRSLEDRVEIRTREIYRLSQLQTVINANAGLAIISTDRAGLIKTFNSAAEIMLGYKAGEAIGKVNVVQFHDPVELLERASELSKIIGEEIKPDFELFSTQINLMLTNTAEWTYFRRDKSKFPVKLTISLFEDADGSIGGYIGVAMDISKEKRVLNSLRESEERFHRMFHEHAAVMLLVDPVSGEIVDANRAAEDYYGYRFDSKFPLKITDINALSEERVKNEMQFAMIQNRNYFEFPHKLASGEVRNVEVHSTPIDVGGKKLLFSIIHDITERKKIEEGLKRSEAENKAILAAIPDLMFRLNRRGIFLSAHYDTDESLYTHEDNFIGKSLQDVLPPEVSIQAENALAQSFLTNETISFEYELLVQGEKHFYENRIQAISEEEALSIVRDISQRKHAELALLWNEEFLKKMTESSPLAFLVVDNRTDDILFANHQFCEIWGINHLEERIRKGELKNNDIIPDCLPVLKDIPAFAETCKPLQFEDNRVIVEDEIPFSDGRTIRRFSTQIRDISDQYHGRLYIFEDISKRKSTEKLVEVQRDLVTKLSATSDLHEALTYMLDSVYLIAEIDAGGIYLFDEQTGNLDLIVSKGLTAEFVKEKSSFSPDSEHAKLVLDGKPIYGRYQQDTFPFIKIESNDKIQSLAVIPIMHEGKVIGSFNLASTTSTSFYAFMQASIESLAMQIGGTIFRIKAEKALLSSQQNFRLLFDTIDDFMFILDINGNILQTNSIVGKRLGYTNEELNQLHVLTVHPPERRDEAGFIVGEMLAGRASFCPVPLHTKDGNQIPVETRVIMGKWDGKDVLFGISRDVTERQRLDAALKMQSAAFESFAHAIIITDGDGRIQWANSSFLRLSGYQMDEIIGRTNGELIKSGRQNKLFYKELWSTIKSGKIWSGELINRKKNGDLYPEELTITPVLDEVGKIRNFIAIKIDITDRKAFEESLRSAIAQEKELNELKSRFVSMASHEFRTPLASILMMSDSLLAYWKRMEDQQIELKLKNIKDQVQHLAKVVTDVMQVSKIQEGKLSFEPNEIDFIGLCSGVIKDFNTDQTLKNKIQFDCKLTNLWMILDSRLILQVLNNLVSNAIKYSQPNPVVIIEFKDCNNEFQLSIKDNGIGIPLADQKNMFQPFFRAENAKQIPGNGLGLNIVRESIRLHGGDISFTSNLGKGTTFVVHLSKELLVMN
jgi:PAS domain S-box-containing protein